MRGVWLYEHPPSFKTVAVTVDIYNYEIVEGKSDIVEASKRIRVDKAKLASIDTHLHKDKEGVLRKHEGDSKKHAGDNMHKHEREKINKCEKEESFKDGKLSEYPLEVVNNEEERFVENQAKPFVKPMQVIENPVKVIEKPEKLVEKPKKLVEKPMEDNVALKNEKKEEIAVKVEKEHKIECKVSNVPNLESGQKKSDDGVQISLEAEPKDGKKKKGIMGKLKSIFKLS